MNSVILIGRTVRDPELRATQSGRSVCTFTLAVDRRGKSDAADFIACVAWEKTAEVVKKYGAKGKMIAVRGSVQTRSYETNDGKRYVTEVVADEVQLLSQKGENEVFEEPFVPMDGYDERVFGNQR